VTRLHVLDIDGEPQTGTWVCRRCRRTFAYAVDGRTDCGPAWPWPADRIAAFIRRARAHWT